MYALLHHSLYESIPTALLKTVLECVLQAIKLFGQNKSQREKQ